MDSAIREMTAYIKNELLRRPELEIEADTRLVSSGLIDSLALVNLLLKLEEVTALRIAPSQVQPKDFETVRMMVAMAQRVGVRR